MLGSKKKEQLLEELVQVKGENIALTKQVESLQSQLNDQLEQNKKLSEALIAAVSPRAHQAQINREIEESISPEQGEALERHRKEMEVLSSYAEAQESPLFEDAEDMFKAIKATEKIDDSIARASWNLSDPAGEQIQPGNEES